MKKKFAVSLLLVLMLVIMSLCVMVACNEPKGETVPYSVTVMKDGQLVSGITVNWSVSSSVKGSAVTGADGKATAQLPSGTYTVSLLGYEEGLDYTRGISVSASMRNVILELTVEQVTYSATVIAKDGNPANGVTVNWFKGTTPVKSAVTGADGKASCTLDYGDYDVMVANLPSGNVFVGSRKATPSSPSVEFRLVDGVTFNYGVTVQSEGGLLFKKMQMLVFSGSSLVSSGETNDNGVFNFTLPAGTYSVEPFEVTDGYTYTPATVSNSSLTQTLVLYSKPIMDTPAEGLRYVMGDIIHNYSFTTPYKVDGNNVTVTIAELLKTKKAILLNNWGTQCTYCMQEFPAMREAYEKYKDKIEIIAVSNYQGGDSDVTIERFYEQYKDEFVLTRDYNGLASKFGLEYWPTTVVIDRYGAIARIETGAVLDSETWGRLIEKYIGDDYVQTFIPGTHESDSINNEIAKPDITVDEDHYEKVAEAINNTDSFPENTEVVWSASTYEYAWPFILGSVEGVSEDEETLLYASNVGKANSIAIIYATVTMPIGKVFAFDYFADSQKDGDILSFVWDGKIVREISGNSDGWKTCYLYTDITEDVHTLGITYIKNRSINVGKDNVFVKNVRFTNISDINEPTDMVRSAAYGIPEETATSYPHYVNTELSEEDGYYHVILSSLNNHEQAGVDESPMLFVNMLNSSNWSGYSLSELILGVLENGNYAVNCNFTVNGVTQDWRPVLTKYLYTASASDIYGFLPVDKELHDLLIAFMRSANLRDSHSNEWLEACYFYSHYGDDGNFVGNPIMGLTEKTAIAVEEGTKITANLTKVMAPFPNIIYSFTAPSDGVYKFESFIPDKDKAQYAAQMWLYDDSTDVEHPILECGVTHIILDGKNEHNFEAYHYMKAGEKYYLCVAFQMSESGTYDFSITNVGATAEALLPCSDNLYDIVLDGSGEATNKIVLAGAVKYEYDENEDRYYAIQPDGTRGSLIYFNVGFESLAILKTPIKDSLNVQAVSPADFKTPLGYTIFDFSKRIIYRPNAENPKVFDWAVEDVTVWNEELGTERYKDYTDFVRSIVESAPTSGKTNGLVPVTKDIMEFLSLYLEMRNNSLTIDGDKMDIDPVLENEWLRFCWYFRTYDENKA